MKQKRMWSGRNRDLPFGTREREKSNESKNEETTDKMIEKMKDKKKINKNVYCEEGRYRRVRKG